MAFPAGQQLINNVLEPVRRQLTVQITGISAPSLRIEQTVHVIEDRAKSFGVTAGETTRIAVDPARSLPGHNQHARHQPAPSRRRLNLPARQVSKKGPVDRRPSFEFS